MPSTLFIELAYGSTAAILALFCLATWLRARAVKAQLKAHPKS